MSTRIIPCFGCPLRVGCLQRDEFRAKARRLGAISVRFRCPILAARITPGTRIEIMAPFPRVEHMSWEPEIVVGKRPVAATITCAYINDHSFLCVIDPGQGVGMAPDGDPDKDKTRLRRFRKRMRAQRIVAFLDETPAELCGAGNPIRNGKCDTGNGYCQCPTFDSYTDKIGSEREPFREDWEKAAISASEIHQGLVVE